VTLYFITGNKNKLHEFRQGILDLESYSADLTEIQSLDPNEVIKHKLLEALEHKEAEFIIEDTCFELDCLNGFPGTYAKDFLKVMTNEDIVNLTLKMGNSKTNAKTIIGYAKSKDEIYFFEGRLDGDIVAPRGDHGFGWDPIFLPEGESKTLAEMTTEEKNKVSYRGKALDKLVAYFAD
jgi:non-canonical purine NTP pyrophosphatase (RdgB/HAM1 family)